MNFTPLWTAALNAFSNFIIVDEHCRIAYMNKPYTEILNVQLEDVIGKPIKSVIPTTKLPEVMASGKAHIGALMTLYDHKTGKDISFVLQPYPFDRRWGSHWRCWPSPHLTKLGRSTISTQS